MKIPIISKANMLQREIFNRLKAKNVEVEKAVDGDKNCSIILTSLMASRAGADVEKTLRDAQVQGKIKKASVCPLTDL